MSMHVYYEEDGGFKVGTVLADNDTSLQVEAQHGKRSKIKSANVLLRFNQPSPGELMSAAQKTAEEVDIDFLWQVSSQDEFVFTELGREYFGHEPTAVESAALLMRLHAAPMYFYKKGKGRYKAAPEDALKAALAGAERKRLQEELKAKFVAQLRAGELPESFRAVLHALLFKPDKNSVEYKALEEAAKSEHASALQILVACKAFASPLDYHLGKFLFEHFPRGTGFGALDTSPADARGASLPLAPVQAFSIDDATTTEIDDAFSVTRLSAGGWSIGVHIAAPALGIAPESELDAAARARLSTVYFPGDKITMLPPALIDAYTLREGQACAALSMYIAIDANYAVRGIETRLERVNIAANLRHDSLERDFNHAALEGASGDYAYKNELRVLWEFAKQLEAARGKPEPPGRVDYNFYVEDDRVRIVPRVRGAPIDKVVSELMIFVNTEWGRQLAASERAGIFRTQVANRTAMSTQAAPHEGLGVKQYAWSSSPLRRYVDLVNQRQLIALIENASAPYARDERLLSIVRDFEAAYDAYSDIQRQLERYWCLRYLQQEAIEEADVTALRENVVRFNDIPLYTKAHGADLAPGSSARVAIRAIDPWSLEVNCEVRRA
jgi:exoribonuclease II